MLEGIENYYEEEIPQTFNPTTKGVMYGFYAQNQLPKCNETKELIKAGERFVFHKNLFYSTNSKTYHREFPNAQNHEW